MPRLGTWEIVAIVVVVLFIFGAGRLPQTLGALGKGVRDFRRAVSGENTDTEILESKSYKEEPTKEKDTSDE
jgi:sec-independent protein translocase protein TatA